MKFVLALVFVMGASASVDEEFQRFKVTFGKSYSNHFEEQARKLIFANNLITIKGHNKKLANGETSFGMNINQFADMLPADIPTGYITKNRTKINMHVYDSSEQLPKEIDWRTKGAVTPVKDQGRCKSFWAFSTTGTLEGVWAIKTGNLVSLSEQNLLDCAKRASYGCAWGGWPHAAITFVHYEGGIDSEDEYPYTSGNGVDGDSCKYRKPAVKVKVHKVKDIPWSDEKALQSAVAKVGPISIGINATPDFAKYSHGIFDATTVGCDPEGLNHALLVVGYGTDAKTGKDYWIVKNSWGTSWGEQGYGKMARNKNLCGIANMATYPVV